MQLEPLISGIEDDNNNISLVSSIERVRKQYTPKNDVESMDAGSDFEQYAAEAQTRAKARIAAKARARARANQRNNGTRLPGKDKDKERKQLLGRVKGKGGRRQLAGRDRDAGGRDDDNGNVDVNGNVNERSQNYYNYSVSDSSTRTSDSNKEPTVIRRSSIFRSCNINKRNGSKKRKK